jgi:hypothetical protein
MLDSAPDLVLDLGPCPWCGEEELEFSGNGLAAGRRPPSLCCERGAVAALLRHAAAMRATEEREREEVVKEYRALLQESRQAFGSQALLAVLDEVARSGVIGWRSAGAVRAALERREGTPSGTGR